MDNSQPRKACPMTWMAVIVAARCKRGSRTEGSRTGYFTPPHRSLRGLRRSGASTTRTDVQPCRSPPDRRTVHTPAQDPYGVATTDTSPPVANFFDPDAAIRIDECVQGRGSSPATKPDWDAQPLLRARFLRWTLTGLGSVELPPCSRVINCASWASIFSVHWNDVSAITGLNRCRAMALA